MQYFAVILSTIVLLAVPAAAQANHHLTSLTGLTAEVLDTMSMEEIGEVIVAKRERDAALLLESQQCSRGTDI
ncbi:hypothetical protein [Roseobacter sp. HKCCA0434]|uniref:hypothetical protein n=1 Tax=Roseobacter sp. HKCCA0434 TaxID=3079297 RepID=UPI002905DBF3|nr:hypothetical protein [Roseobacter sp. HKCCA0434]